MCSLYKNSALYFIVILLFKRSTLIRGQNTQFNGNQFSQCDQNRLQRCQQSIVYLVSQTNSGITNLLQDTNQFSQCSSIRSNLDCLLVLTPLCQENGISTSTVNSVDLIYRSKTYLDKNCDQGNGWRTRVCFSRANIQQCENTYNNQLSTIISSPTCENFLIFRECVTKAVRSSCSAQDMQLLSSYLIDKGEELSWSCPSTQSYALGILNPSYNQFSNNNNNGVNNLYGLFGTNYNSLAANNALNNNNNNVLLTNGNNCYSRAAVYVRSCEDNLIKMQKDARKGRSGYDTQRRICCALFYFRDCISRTVVEQCTNPSPTSVDLLMGSRNRELTETCRDYSQSQCSRSSIVTATNGTQFAIFVINAILYYLSKSV